MKIQIVSKKRTLTTNVSEILIIQKIRLALLHGSHASLILVCTGKAVFVRSFYVLPQNRIHRRGVPCFSIV